MQVQQAPILHAVLSRGPTPSTSKGVPARGPTVPSAATIGQKQHDYPHELDTLRTTFIQRRKYYDMDQRKAAQSMKELHLKDLSYTTVSRFENRTMTLKTAKTHLQKFQTWLERHPYPRIQTTHYSSPKLQEE